ncbi:MAG: prolipoprotein diacylglyceryl transferase [Planctomycetota bacterium]|jgi:phosphatidylglycerol:prolipoprotein diacylglycerol transferase
MPGSFVHSIDPVIADAGGIYLWWYGLSYSLGFLGIHLWFRRAHRRLGMTLSEVYSISLYLGVGVLLGGRFVEVVFYEWDYYSDHLLHIPAYWLGGMATHGLLLGGTLGTLLFCWRRRRRFLTIADELVIPVAWVMGVGRIGNFIDGQISGAITDVWWAVQFPDLEGFRHPVVLYDGLKNLLLIPFLLWISRRRPPRGVVFAHFVFWYAFLRLFVDLFREYRVDTLGLGTGQMINISMSILGLALLIWFDRRKHPSMQTAAAVTAQTDSAVRMTLWVQRVLFGFLLLFSLTMPSDWTQDIPERYKSRHPGLRYSFLYPRIEERVPIRETQEERLTPNHDIQPTP